MYQERFYREQVRSKFKLEVSYKQSDLLISSDKALDKNLVKEVLIKYYTQIEDYVNQNPDFKNSLSPLKPNSEAPAIVKDMIGASSTAGIGPFSAVAGAIALYLGRELLTYADEVIVENGGDLFLKINQDKRLGIYLGENFDLKKINLKVKKRSSDFGIASSSSTIGHSLNFGKADLVTVVAKDAIIADSFATSLSNQIKKESDVQPVIELAKGSGLIEGLLIAFTGKLFLWGDLEAAN